MVGNDWSGFERIKEYMDIWEKICIIDRYMELILDKQSKVIKPTGNVRLFPRKNLGKVRDNLRWEVWKDINFFLDHDVTFLDRKIAEFEREHGPLENREEN